MIRAITIDDNPQRREAFEKAILDLFNFPLKIDSFSTFKASLKLLNRERIDIVFCFVENDSNLKIDWIKHCEPETTEVVLICSQPSVALQAIRLKVLDILIYPYSGEELKGSIQRLEAVIRRKKELAIILHSVNVNRLKQNESMFIKTTRSYIHVWMHTLTRLEADGNYTYLFLNDDRRILTSNHLKKYELVLRPHDFYRVNKSYLVNLHYVRFFHKGKASAIEMEDGFKTEVSRREKKGLKERLESIASHTF